jgi:hypothetical protein
MVKCYFLSGDAMVQTNAMRSRTILKASTDSFLQLWSGCIRPPTAVGQQRSCIVFFRNREKPAARAREPRHDSADRHLGSLGNLTIGQPMKIS